MRRPIIQPICCYWSCDGVHIAPLHLWQPIYFATIAVNSLGGQVNGNQQLTRENAWFPRMEDRLGAIESDRLADLLVLERDYCSVPDL